MTTASCVRVVYVTDPSFKRLTEFSAASLMLNSASQMSIIVYTTAPSRPLDEKLQALALKLGHSIQEAPLAIEAGVAAGVSLHPHISQATLFKAQAIENEAASYEHILFLDADILACNRFSLPEVFNFGTTAAAVYDFVSYMPFDNQDLFKHRESSGRSPDYFNAGVIAISGSKWTERKTASRYVESLHRHTGHCPFRHDEHGDDPGDCKGADQCAFNMALEGDWTPLDFRWNVQKPLRHNKLWRQAYLRHYTGFRKFLAKSSVNRDSVERKVLRSIELNAGMAPDEPISNDFGILFLADAVKYFTSSLAYGRKVKFLYDRAQDRLTSG